MGDIIKLCPLGGLDEKGRDCYIIEINNDIFVLDCGSVQPDKSIPGVDFLLPNADYLIKNKNKLRGYFITHGHDENMGALKYFYDKAPAPIYCTEATKVIMCGQAEMYDVHPNFHFSIIKPSDTIVINNREITFFQTCHNAAYSCGVAIDTDKGYIVYTGDFIVDYSLNNTAFKFDIKQLYKLAQKETLILLAESKTADKIGYCSPKHEAVNHIEKFFKDNKRIFINCFWQNMFRIYEIIDLCKKYKKKLYFYNKYSRDIFYLILSFEPKLLDVNSILGKDDLLRERQQDIVVLMLGKGEELFTEMKKIVNGTNEDKRITLKKDDIFINCALPTPSLETLATRCIDTLYRTEAEIAWIKSKDLTSMHAKQDDLKFFLSVLKPKYYFPVRGMFVEMMANAKLALSMNIGLNHSNVFIVDNGMQIFIDELGKAKIISNEVNQILTDPVIVDGKGVSIIGSEIIDDRLRLGRDGLVIVASTISLSKRSIIAGPDCQMRGFVYVKEAEPMLKMISNIYIEELTNALASEKFISTEVELVIKDRIKKFIKRENGREPLVHPIIITID